MHTFFINTSGKEIENYSDILEIQHETRKMVSLDCPIENWQSSDNGYESCADEMGELIDSYKEMTNQFNLIIYVNLIDFKPYSSIPMDKHRERYACLSAIYALFTHYINATLVKKLSDAGREPRETLIIFEENPKPKDGEHDNTEDGKNMVREQIRCLLGLPCVNEINEVCSSDEPPCVESFFKRIALNKNSRIAEGVCSTYSDEIDTFLNEFKIAGSAEEPLRRLADRVVSIFDEERKTIHSVSFATNRRADILNKQEGAKRDLRLCAYLLDCVRSETIFNVDENYAENKKTVKQFPHMNDRKWKDVLSALCAKKAIFRKTYKAAVSISDRYSELELTPELYQLDRSSFALDEFGGREKIFEVVDVNGIEPTSDKEKNPNEGIVSKKKQRAVVEVDPDPNNLFGDDKFKFFTQKDTSPQKPGKGMPAEEYEKAALKLKEFHSKYLRGLSEHISGVLSNYAGREYNNGEELLKKRSVSVDEEDCDDIETEYHYVADPNDPKVEDATKKSTTIKSVAENAYKTVQIRYLEFCAGREVAMTDIDKNCNKFMTRVDQIRESLRKIKLVALGLLIAIFVLYIPFAVIQWEAITANITTLAVALCSIGVPLVLLYAVFTVLSIKQRKKYAEAWDEFEAESTSILESNKNAAKKFDQLLSFYIPSLRWVYEYKLDVDFYIDCCEIAKAKINHHILKLHDREEAVGNIIEDLEMDVEAIERQTKVSAYSGIDYNMAFASSDDNREFYSILDENLLKAINETGEQ